MALNISKSQINSAQVEMQQDTLIEEIEVFNIKGKAAYGNGVTVFDAEVTLLDTK